MNVAENLYDYLKNNDKAELVGLGTFYVKNHSARINELTGTIEPPKRELFFTREQNGDMGFVSFMAAHEFISESTAHTWIKQYSDSLNEKILSGRSVSLGKLGKIEKGLLEDYTFTADGGLNLLDNVFALGTLKNVQTFDSADDSVDLLHTKKPVETQETTQSLPEDFQDKKAEIEKQIEQTQQLKEEYKIQESEQQTQTRIIQHSQAEIESDVEKPQNLDKETANLNLDTASDEDKLQQTIDRAAEFKENVIVEDIKPAKPQDDKQKAAAAKATQQEDILKKQAEDIVKKHSKKKIAIKKIKHSNRRKKSWLIVFWIIIALLLLCAAFVGAHWMGWLKDIKLLTPVTDKLSYYIPVREAKPVKAEQPLTQTTTETVVEQTYTEEEILEEVEIPEPAIAVQQNTAAANTPKTPAKAQNTKAKQQKTQQEEQPAPVATQEETVKEDNSPVLVQNYSKLGFDVVSGAYSDKSKAEAQARKARRLGYDGYVISKIKNGTPIYYASYGSRRTLSEANDLAQSMMNRLGGNYTVISR